MTSNKERLEIEVKELIDEGTFLMYDEAIVKEQVGEKEITKLSKSKGYKKFKTSKRSNKTIYQRWFSKSYNVVKQILPDRHQEFYSLYKDEKAKTKDIDNLSYSISHYFLGLTIRDGWEKETVNPFKAFWSKMEIQLSILDSCEAVLNSKLADIEGMLQYELFENELQAAKDLLSKKYIRAAGALAGVTLEVHLSKVCKQFGIKFRKKNPTISNFNEELKNQSIIDMPTWRLIQRLGDIRNMSVHSKEREPHTDEVHDLIRGCEKLISELN